MPVLYGGSSLQECRWTPGVFPVPKEGENGDWWHEHLVLVLALGKAGVTKLMKLLITVGMRSTSIAVPLQRVRAGRKRQETKPKLTW